MQEFKIRFVENRLIFEDTSSGQVPATLPEGEHVPVGQEALGLKRQQESLQAGARLNTGYELRGARTEMDLNILKSKMGQDFENFLKVTSLQGEKYVRSLDVDKLEFYSERRVIDLSEQILFAIKRKGGLVQFASILEANPQDVEKVISQIYARSFLKQAEDKFKSEYADFVKDRKTDVPENLEFVIEPDAFGGTNITFNLPKNIKDAYVIYKKERKSAQSVEGGKAGAESGEKQPDPKAQSAADRTERIEQLKQSPIGKVLGFLGFNNAVDGKTGFERIIDGESPFGCFILGMFGYSALSGGAYEGVVEMLPKEFQDRVKVWEKKAKESRFGSKGAEAIAEKSLESLDLSKFHEIVKGKKPLPEKGAKLERTYVLGSGGRPKGLKIDLAQGKGGGMILPGGSSLRIDDQAVSVKKEERREYDAGDGVLTINDRIPAGTIFKGDVRFEAIRHSAEPAMVEVGEGSLAKFRPAEVSPKESVSPEGSDSTS